LTAKPLSAKITFTFEPGELMGTDGQPVDETDIQVGPPEGAGDAGSEGDLNAAKGAADKVLDKPAQVVNRLKRRYKNLNKRDKGAVLLFFLVVVMVIVLLSMWSTGGGIGGPDLGPEIRPPNDWNIQALDPVDVSGNEENTNLAGQETPYLVPLTPAPGEIFFLTTLHCQVTWADETTPPVQNPAIGYTNQPDGFYLIIRVHDSLGEWESDLVFNPIGSSQDIVMDINVAEYLGSPIAVASREGADYLPQGYVESIRVDFIVVTEDCGPWTTNDPRPNIGDGGNHYTFDWSLGYRLADSTKEP
jgi:hypothetical protein